MKSFAVLGSGMQGTAAAYDLVSFASPSRVLLGDIDPLQAQRSAERVNRLTGTSLCVSRQVDALDSDALGAFLEGADVLLSCLPYWMHEYVLKVAIERGVSMVDLGGNTELTLRTLAMDERAKQAGITYVPDTGLAPGLVNSLGCSIIESLDQTDSVKLYCGVLPQHPKPPFNYKLTFNVEGLVTEYDYRAVVLREGAIQEVATLDELETIVIDELGTMEAFTTSGGVSTAPFTFEGKVNSYEYKTIRHPGHCALMRIFKDFGFWGEEMVDVRGTCVRPKDVFNAVFGPELAKYEDRDLCAIRAVGSGMKDGHKAKIQIDIFDKECERTGFTSMERLTGFSCAIVAQEVAAGRVPAGAVRYENAMPGKRFLAELARRGIEPKVVECIEA